VVDYDSARAGFSWDAAREALDGLPGGRGLNIAHEAIDRHAAGGGRERVAVRWLRRDGRVDEATYGQLAAATNRFANALRGLGVGPGERVFTLLGRVPELHVAVLGTLKNRSVVCPLFSAFGPEPVRQRLDLGDARVLVTTPALYRRKVAPIRQLVPLLEHVILVGADRRNGGVEGAVAYDDLMSAAAPLFTIPPTAPEDRERHQRQDGGDDEEGIGSRHWSLCSWCGKPGGDHPFRFCARSTSMVEKLL
jgi:acetyl-CoA synthetase